MKWLVIAIVAVLLLVFVVRRIRERQVPVVLVTSEGVRVSGWRLDVSLAWDDVCRIAVVRLPTVAVKDLCIELVPADESESLAVYDTYAGFDEFQARMFERWPAIEREWRRVHNGPPDGREEVTLWRKGAG